MPTTETFSEDNLRRSIAGVWGEHGGHIDVYDEIVKRARNEDRLRQAVVQAVEELSLCDGYPSPVARAVEILKRAEGGQEGDGCK